MTVFLVDCSRLVTGVRAVRMHEALVRGSSSRIAKGGWKPCFFRTSERRACPPQEKSTLTPAFLLLA